MNFLEYLTVQTEDLLHALLTVLFEILMFHVNTYTWSTGRFEPVTNSSFVVILGKQM